MKIPALFTCVAAAVLAALPLRPAVAQDDAPPPGGEVTFNLFYDNLSDDGEWYNTPDYGYVWQPDIAYGADTKWRPYTDGYWAQTDSGWTWVSYENFGWATYHYGRWTRLKDIGWAWVPGYEWGPGWVSWRTDNDYVGWAPLPPKADRAVYEGKLVTERPRRVNVDVIDYNDVESVDTGYTSDVDYDYDIGPENYCFVENRSFGAPVLSEVILPPQRNVVIIERTTNVTNIYYDRRGRDDCYVYNSGPDYNFLSGRVDRPIQRLQIEQRRDPGFLSQGLRAGGNPTQVHNGILQVAAPLFARRPTNFQQIKPPRVKQTLAQPQVVRGWSNSGANPQTVDRLRNRFKEQAQQAPQKAVQPKEQIVQSLPPAQRVVTKSDLPVAPAKDMSADAVASRRAERQQQRAANGDSRPGQAGQPGQAPNVGQPGQAAQPGQPKDLSPEAKAARRAERQAARNGQPGQPGQPGAAAQPGQPATVGPRPGAMTEEERKARRDTAIQQKAARDQERAGGPASAGQPAQADQPGQPGQPKDTSPEAKAARRAQRQQERANHPDGQPADGPAQTERTASPTAPKQAAQPKDLSDEAKAARRAQRQQERAAQQNSQPGAPATQAEPIGQPVPQKDTSDEAKAARRAQRQQERAAQPGQNAPRPQAQPQGNPQADQEREQRHAQRQQERAQAQPQAQQEQQANQEREARQAQRQQERANQQQAQQQQARQQQADQERESRQAQRQQERANQQQQAQQQAQQQRAAQQPQQAAPAQGNPDRDARRAARQAERGKQDDNKPNQ